MLECLLGLWPSSLVSQSLVVGVVVGITAYLLLKKRYKLPPGPRGLPILGSALSLYNCPNWYRELEKWSKQYGPVMHMKILGKDIIVLSNIEVALEALVKRGSDFAGRPSGYAGDVFTEGGNNIINGPYGPRWKLHRKLASKAIRNYLLGDNLSKKLSESLAVTTDLMKKETKPFDPFPYLSLIVYNILSGMCFNKRRSDSTNDEGFILFVSKIDQMAHDLLTGFLEDYIPLMRFCPTAKLKRFSKACDDLQDAIKLELEEHKRTLNPDEHRDFLDSLLVAQQEAEKDEDPALLSQITDCHVRMTIQDIFFGGIETSRVTLHWALLAMALHPDIQKKVHNEVDAVIGPDLIVDVSTRDGLCYTEAVLHEVMRMRPAGPIGVPHETICDSTVGGYEIPRGTLVGVNHYALHFDPDQWEEPNTFRPERFLDTSGTMAPKPDSWLPFSAGRRVCLGETVAKPELHLLFAGLCRAFTIELAPGTTHDYEPTGSAIDITPGQYLIVVKPRP